MMQEFVDQISKTAQEATDAIHTALPGEIVSFDPATGLASVQPKAKFRKPDGQTIDFPIVSGVPVHYPLTGGIAIAWPVKKGDACIVIFSESALDFWQYGKETGTVLKFDLSNAMVIPGLSARRNAAMEKACAEDAIVLRNGGTTVTIKAGGVTIDGSLTVNGAVAASGDVTGGGVSLKGHTHTGDSGGSTSAPR